MGRCTVCPDRHSITLRPDCIEPGPTSVARTLPKVGSIANHLFCPLEIQTVPHQIRFSDDLGERSTGGQFLYETGGIRDDGFERQRDASSGRRTLLSVAIFGRTGGWPEELGASLLIRQPSKGRKEASGWLDSSMGVLYRSRGIAIASLHMQLIGTLATLVILEVSSSPRCAIIRRRPP